MSGKPYYAPNPKESHSRTSAVRFQVRHFPFALNEDRFQLNRICLFRIAFPTASLILFLFPGPQLVQSLGSFVFVTGVGEFAVQRLGQF